MNTNMSCVDNNISAIYTSICAVKISAQNNLAVVETKIDRFKCKFKAGSTCANIVNTVVAYTKPETGQAAILSIN